MKVGVIGAGYWGIKHVDEYNQIGVGVLVSDLDDKRLEECKDRFGAETTKDYKDILKDDDIKAVSICTPNKTHYDLCRECIDAGKHVLLEKPMALEYGKAKELVELAKSKGIVLSVGHLYRYNNAILKLKEMVDKEEFGDIYNIKMVWTFLEKVFPDRDILFDLAIHPFDIINFVFGKNPDNVFTLARGFRQENEEIAFVNSMLGNIMINFELSWITPEKARDLIVVGSKKTTFIQMVAQKMKIRDNETGADKEIEIEESNTIRDELEDFLKCVNSGETPVANGEVGAEIVRVVENIRKM